MSFINKFIEQEKVNRRDLLLASAFGLGGAAAAGLMGLGMARSCEKTRSRFGCRNGTGYARCVDAFDP